MVLLKKYKIGQFSQIQAVSIYRTVLFEYQAPLYGKNHRLPSFAEHGAPTKFIIRKFSDLDCVFISSSLSFGVFFLRNVRIYMTKPVYEQLLLRYEEYRDMPTVYDDLTPEEVYEAYFRENQSQSRATEEDYDIVTLDQINIEEFSRCVVIVKYNQIVPIGSLEIQPQSSGTFIGWCNYKMVFSSGETLLLLFSYSARGRFSIEAPPIETDYLLISRDEIGSENQIFDFSDCIVDYIKSSSRRVLIIPTDLETFFIEVIFHVLSLAESSGVRISIVSPIFRRLDLLLNIQSEWLNKNFFSISEPFPLRKYKNLGVFNSIFDAAFGDGGKNIIFCGCRYWDLLKNKKIFRESETIYINYEPHRICGSFADGRDAREEASKRLKVSRRPREELEYLPGIAYVCSDDVEELESKERAFRLKVESTDEEILQGYKGKILTMPEVYFHSERLTDSIFVDSRLPVINGKLLISGTLINSDFDSPEKITMILEDRSCFLKEVIRGEVPIFVDGWFYCRNSKIKFRSRDSDQVEYYRF